MATSSTYYINGPALESSTAVFLDAGLSMIAPDGFYSDGVNSREQVSGVLLPQQTCEECIPSIPCGGGVVANGAQGIYRLDVELGSDTGAILIRFNPNFVPDGIQAIFDSTIYNGLSSPNDGWHEGTIGLPTYLGDIPSDCGLVAGSPYVLNEYAYDGAAFVLTGGTDNVTIVSGQLSLTDGMPGDCVMVIPKLFATPSILHIDVIGACSSTGWQIEVDCPQPLEPIMGTANGFTSGAACANILSATYYHVPVNGTAEAPAVNDMLYADLYGQVKLASVLSSGYYKLISNTVVYLNSDSVITSVSTC